MHRRVAVVLSAVALTGALVGCSEEAIAPEQGVDAGTPDGRTNGETGSGEGGQVGVDGSTDATSP
ncbi:MAG TPA: hypothetical protein VM433_02370 [Mycobacteriales bacterium]|nr:hypothetical protein [Mycobacteriales bacterium]